MKGEAEIVGNEVRVGFTLPLLGTINVDAPPRRVAEPEELPPEKSRATHSPGFTAVNWFGTVYYFTPKQRRVVASLWQAWKGEEGDGAIHQDVLLSDAESDQQKLRDLFDRGDHPAWGTMIIAALDRGGQRGCYMLNVAAED